jgi:hypothetical protein
MRSKGTRFTTVAAATLAMMLVVAATAFAAAPTHITTRSASSIDTSFDLTSVGDAGQIHGNFNAITSPVDNSGSFAWFNQDVTLLNFHIVDSVDGDDDVIPTGGTYRINTDGTGYGASADFTGDPTFSAEGVYSIVAIGVDAVTLTGVTGTAVEPAFGIDKTKPTSTSDATAAYAGGTATISITATDTMSGVQDVRTSLDSGPWDYTWDGTTGNTVVDVTTAIPGAHTLKWEVFDNAGNMETHTVSFIMYVGAIVDINASAGPNGSISPNGTTAVAYGGSQGYTIMPYSGFRIADVLVDGVSVGAVSSYTFTSVTAPHTISASFAAALPTAFSPWITLGVQRPGSSRHALRFYGNIAQMSNATTMVFTVQRKSGRRWVRYTSFATTIPATAGTFSVNRTISRNGTFRVQATDSCGASNWVTFRTN